MKNSRDMSKDKKASEASRNFSDIIKNLKIDSIVVVDDVRNLTPEEIKKIHDDLKKSGGSGDANNV